MILIWDPIHPDGIAALQGARPIVEAFQPEAREAAIASGMAEALIVRTSPIDGALLDRLPKMRVIGKHGVGVDNIDIAAATARGIAVFNTPGANALAVAEGAVALMLAVVKRLRAAHDLVAEGRFVERGPWRAGDLSGKTLGLVGGGRIACEVARICGRGFDMPVLIYDPHLVPEATASFGAERCARLEDVLARADIVSIHVPLTAETRGMIGRAAIATMKPGAVLINTARGGIVDEVALAEALAAGRLAGAGLDVFASEPPDPSDPLLRLGNVVLSPHVAGITEDSARRMALDVAEGVLSALAEHRPPSLLNPEAWPPGRVG